MKSNKVLITGGTGFIGFHLTNYLIDKGYQVRLLVRKNSPNLAKLDDLKVEKAYGDICDLDSMRSAFENIDVVFHCAAYVSDWGKKESYSKINIEGTRNVLEACISKKVKRFVGLSTNDVFGRIEDKVIDESFSYQPWSEPYPDSKLEAEKLIWEYHKRYDLDVTMTYPCWVYGPEDTTFLPHLVEAIEDGSFLYWRKDSHFYPTYIENLLDQLHVIAFHPAAVGNGYLIHDGSFIKLKDFCNKLSSALNLKEVSLRIPYFLAYTVAKLMEMIWSIIGAKSRPLLTTYVIKNFGGKIQYSQNKAKRELNWEPPYSFEEGFEKTMTWLRKQ